MNKLKARIDAFNRLIVDAKTTGVWDSIEAACIMAGWSNVAGALTPLKGAAPTNNGFIDSDLDAGIGLKGDGSSKYIDSNRANNADGQNDAHRVVWVSNRTQSSASGSNLYPCYFGDSASAGSDNLGRSSNNSDNFFVRSRTGTNSPTAGAGSSVGLLGTNRDSASGYSLYINSVATAISMPSQTPTSTDLDIFHATSDGVTYADATLPFYSIGSSVDLAALDTVVSQLAADLRAIDEDGFDPLATDYIRRVEAADGAYLETGVKQAINAFVVGCRKDGTLDALKASCILCGARTISGALVPLVGPAPTAEGAWASGDYDRATGMKGNGSSLYLDSNRANDADGQDDRHMAVYATTLQTNSGLYIDGYPSGNSLSYVRGLGTVLVAPINGPYRATSNAHAANGFLGVSRFSSTLQRIRGSGVEQQLASDSFEPPSRSVSVFGPTVYSDARLAFYSLGSSLDLSLLDNRASTLISSISAALS